MARNFDKLLGGKKTQEPAKPARDAKAEFGKGTATVQLDHIVDNQDDPMPYRDLVNASRPTMETMLPAPSAPKAPKAAPVEKDTVEGLLDGVSDLPPDLPPMPVAVPQASAPAPQVQALKIDVDAILDTVSTKMTRMLQPFEERLASVEAQVETALNALTTLVDVLQGSDEDISPMAGGDGKAVGLKGHVERLTSAFIETKEKLETIEGQFYNLVGPGGESVDSYVKDNLDVAADYLVEILRKKEIVPAEIAVVAVERGPESTKAILTAIAGNPSFAYEVLARVVKQPVAKLEDTNLLSNPEVANARTWVDQMVPVMASRAKYCLDNLQWDNREWMEQLAGQCKKEG